MAYSSIPSSWLDVGDPAKKELFDLIRSNQIDLDSRTTAVEGASGKLIVYNGIMSNASSAGSLTGIMFERVASNFSITDAKLYVFDFTGITTGTLELDVRKSTTADFTTDASIFSTKPSINFATATNYDESSNAVISAGSFVAGDYIRIDISSLPATTLGQWGVYIIGEAS